MPRMSPRDAPGRAGPVDRTPTTQGPVSWFWEPPSGAGDDGADDPHATRTDRSALLSMVLGLAGLVAVVIGESHHFGGVADAAVAAAALGGTVSAVVISNVALSRIRSSAGRLRGRLLGHIALVEAWSAVLLVFVSGMLTLLRSRA